MTLVDTTVWVDFFRGRNTPQVRSLERLLREGEDICTCGLVLTEVLQGIAREDEYSRTLSRFQSLIFLPMDRDTFVQAAGLYRQLRSQGITIRKPVDCMIASVAIQHGVALLHNDQDYDHIEKHCGLKVLRTVG